MYYYVPLYCTTQYYTVLNYIVLYCNILYYIVQNCTGVYPPSLNSALLFIRVEIILHFLSNRNKNISDFYLNILNYSN